MTESRIRLNSSIMDDADSHVDPEPGQPKGRENGRVLTRMTWRAMPLALFLPAVAVALGYACLWIYLVGAGRGDGNLARISLLVLVIGVPGLLAYAGLRLSTIRLTTRGAHLQVHPGFPVRDPVIVTYPSITGLKVKRGLSGWMTGAGSLVIERDSDAAVVVAGLRNADEALNEILARSPALNGLGVRN
jgi:hypothetical protein